MSWVTQGSSLVTQWSSWVTQGSSLVTLWSSWVTQGSSEVTQGSAWVTQGSPWGHPVVTLGHPGFTLGRPGVTLGHQGITQGSLWVTQGSAWDTQGSPWVTLGSPWVTRGSPWVILSEREIESQVLSVSATMIGLELGLKTEMGTMAATGPDQGPKTSPPSLKITHETGINPTPEANRPILKRPSMQIGFSTTKLSLWVTLISLKAWRFDSTPPSFLQLPTPALSTPSGNNWLPRLSWSS